MVNKLLNSLKMYELRLQNENPYSLIVGTLF